VTKSLLCFSAASAPRAKLQRLTSTGVDIEISENGVNFTEQDNLLDREWTRSIRGSYSLEHGLSTRRFPLVYH
jgi:hypothetical protein